MVEPFEVIVIGGGHAGVEAAWAAANLLPAARSVALVTMDPTTIGVMSCNPANGGLAKGQLVREIDALGGVMGLATDATGIQFRMLNTSKGPAVHGPRAQCDKHAYAEAVQRIIASRPEIEVVAGTVERLVVEQEGGEARIAGVEVSRRDGSGVTRLRARAVVLTTGTFMRAIMHTGERTAAGGRFGEGSAVGISGALRDLGFELGRLKTGTPPRLHRDSIDFAGLFEQRGDAEPIPFSDLSGPGLAEADADLAELHPSLRAFPVLAQVSCHQTSTSAAIHDAIRANLHRAPMFSGQIESVGPRYCPSIEDKVVRFADRASHGVFLEPESLRDEWVYCNGISTSLPADVQEAIIRGMPGCAGARVLRYGYAVEYDMVRPHQICATGETRLVAGLFLAGQINGTSGYEEAAAQGLIAGINAARRARGEDEFVLGRDEAYIGVLMDDLTTKTPVEPYRMFTSRAEHRLLLRADNAAERLTPIARRLGMLGSTALGRLRAEAFDRRIEWGERLNAIVESTRIEGAPLSRLVRGDRFELADFQREVARASPDLPGLPHSLWTRVYADRRYEPYIERERSEIRRRAEMEHRRIPDDFGYESCANLRTEARAALARFRPRTFGQASRLEGVTPADVTLLSVLVERHRRRATGATDAAPSP